MRIAIWPDGSWINIKEEPEEFQHKADREQDYYIENMSNRLSEDEIESKVKENIKRDAEYLKGLRKGFGDEA